MKGFNVGKVIKIHWFGCRAHAATPFHEPPLEVWRPSKAHSVTHPSPSYPNWSQLSSRTSGQRNVFTTSTEKPHTNLAVSEGRERTAENVHAATFLLIFLCLKQKHAAYVTYNSNHYCQMLNFCSDFWYSNNKAQIKQKLSGVLNKEIRLRTVQWLRVCSSLAEDPSSVPETHVM